MPANRRSGSFVAVLAQYIAIAIEDGVVKVSRALWNVARSISYIGIGRVLYVAYLFCHQKSVKVAEAV